MNPVLFQCPGVLPADTYLPGQYAWSAAQHVVGADLDLIPPTAGVLTLTLEIDGEATAVAFTIPALPVGLATRRFTLRPSLAVPANAVVRWRAAFTGTAETAARMVALALEVLPDALTQVRVVPPELTVAYVENGLILYRYASGVYSPVNSVNGASVQASANNLVVALSSPFGAPSAEVMRVESGVVWVRGLYVMGGTTPDDGMPSLQFNAGEVSLASVGAGGLWVANLTEATPAAGQANVFEWRDSTGLVAVLGENGLVVRDIREW